MVHTPQAMWIHCHTAVDAPYILAYQCTELKIQIGNCFRLLAKCYSSNAQCMIQKVVWTQSSDCSTAYTHLVLGMLQFSVSGLACTGGASKGSSTPPTTPTHFIQRKQGLTKAVTRGHPDHAMSCHKWQACGTKSRSVRLCWSMFAHVMHPDTMQYLSLW